MSEQTPVNVRERMRLMLIALDRLAARLDAETVMGKPFHLETVVDAEDFLEALPELLDRLRFRRPGNDEAAEAARGIGYDIAELVYEKQLAYGDSGRIANGLWEARLAQYLTEDGREYRIPRELIRHIPRITRLDDRINRIISNPAADRLGENPWRDAVGDCIIGALNAETAALAPDGEGDNPGPNRTGGVSVGAAEMQREAEDRVRARSPHPADTRIWNEGEEEPGDPIEAGRF